METAFCLTGVLYLADFCAMCNKKVGLWLGKNEYKGKYYCGNCLPKFKANERKALINRFQMPDNCDSVQYKNGYLNMERTPTNLYYIWVNNENALCLLSIEPKEDDDYEIFKVPLDSIEYFYFRGEIAKETKISGGGGEIGGSSVTGAVVVGALFGGAGAIIGSRKRGKIEPIKTEIITHDDREAYINVFVDGVKRSLFFKFGAYNSFLKLIPEKEYSAVANRHISESRTINRSKNETNNNSQVIEQIRKLSELKDEGILTEEEFSSKKRELLKRM